MRENSGGGPPRAPHAGPAPSPTGAPVRAAAPRPTPPAQPSEPTPGTGRALDSQLELIGTGRFAGECVKDNRGNPCRRGVQAGAGNLLGGLNVRLPMRLGERVSVCLAAVVRGGPELRYGADI